VAGRHSLYHLDKIAPLAPAAYASWSRRQPQSRLHADKFGAGLHDRFGNAGIPRCSGVIYLKRGDARLVIIIDAAMNDPIRPTLYEAHHDIVPVRQAAGVAAITADVVGLVCESGDYLALGRTMPWSRRRRLAVMHHMPTAPATPARLFPKCW